MGKSWKLLALAGLLLLGYLTFWGGTFLPDSVVPIHDNLVYHQPYFHFVLSGIKYFKEFPLWHPLVSMGMPTLPFTNNYELLMFTHYPFYLLAYFFPELSNSLLLYKVNILLGAVFLAWFTILLLKELSFRPSTLFFGGTTVLFSGYTVGTFYQDQVLATALYVPLVLFLIIRLYRTRRVIYAALAGLFLGQSFNAHYPQLVIYFYLIQAFCLSIFYLPVIKTETAHKKFWLKAGATLSVSAILTSLPLLYNYFHYFPELVSPARGAQADSIAVGYEFIEQTKEINSFWIKHAASFLKPRWLFTPAQATGIFADDTTPFYLGILAIGLVLFSLAGPWTRRKGFWLVSLLLTALFAIGGYGFFYRALFAWIPAARIQRTPLHMSHFLLLALIILAGIGWEELVSRIKGRVAVFVSLLVCFHLFDLVGYTRWAAPGLVDARNKFECLTELTPPFPPTDLDWKVYDRFTRFIWFKDSFAWASKNGYHPRAINSASRVGGSASAGRQTFTEAEFQTEGPSQSPLVWQQNATAQWRVTIDGEPAVTRKTGVFLTVDVPPGEHLVKFRYEATVERIIVYGSMALVVFSLGLLVTALVSERGLLRRFTPRHDRLNRRKNPVLLSILDFSRLKN